MSELFIAYKGRCFEVSEVRFVKHIETYPDVHVWREYWLMDDWLEANPKRRKRNYDRFITNWLKSEQRKASERRKEIDVGRGPSSDVPTVSLVRPEVLERIRARDRK